MTSAAFASHKAPSASRHCYLPLSVIGILLAVSVLFCYVSPFLIRVLGGLVIDCEVELDINRIASEEE